jgi:hypothetical protein
MQQQHPSPPTTVGSKGPDTCSNDPLGDPKSHESPGTPTISTSRKRRAKSPHRIKHAPPALRAPAICFWMSSVQEMPIYHHSPWDFYEPFLALGSRRFLALCNHGAKSRVIRSCPVAAPDWPQKSIFQIQHRNFIHFYKIYLFQGQGFIVSEYIDFSLKEILHNDVYPIEPEVRYITSQVIGDLLQSTAQLF